MKDKVFKPPVDVAEAAYSGLLLRNVYKRGGTRIGIARAHQLSKREPVSLDTIKRMNNFFNRHFKNRNTPPDKGNGMIAWLLWGGDEGRRWAKKILREHD